MALQSLLHDPNISSFLDQIPQNQRIITLKELIYIGIKIVTNQFNKEPTPNQTLRNFANKENILRNSKRQKPQKPSANKNKTQNKLKQKQPHKANQTVNNPKNDKIQSTLLRQISKIRVQLQNLTNKVYDHYFQQENKGNEHDNSLSFNKKRHDNQKVLSHGFHHGQQIPTFSPQRNLKASKSRSQINPFLKQKSGLRYQTQDNNRITGKQSLERSNYPQQQQNFESRNRAKSNLQHLDDTQIRQALYKQDSSQSESEQKVRAKKSQSVIEKRHQMKKKDQQNFFYQINVQKQRLNELKKFEESKINAPQSSYRQFSENLPLRVDHIKKKVKSKIKPEVERDRLRYQNRIEQQNFKKGFQQYQYSANEEAQQQQEDYEEDVDENMDEQESQENDNHGQNQDQQQDDEEDIEAQNQNNVSNKKSNRQYMNSPQQEFERERDISQPNFGFYDSRGRSQSSGAKARSSYNSQNIKNDRIINAANDESSFSQFSEFSISSNNSRRQNGKISRRRND